MSDQAITPRQQEALKLLQANLGKNIELPIRVGTGLVEAGLAVNEKGVGGVSRGYSLYRLA